MSDDFVHLHVHSEYSLLDGLGRTAQLAHRAAELGQPAIALTDHGVMHGAIEFARACKKEGVKPLLGVEAYITQHGRPMSGRDSELDKGRHHLLLLAENLTGYRNLLKICSDAQFDGYYYKPRIDAGYLAAHKEGLICTSGCLAAELPTLIRNGQEDLAIQRLHWYRETFGPDHWYMEFQEHDIPELTDVNKRLFEFARRYDVPMIVTNDVHFVREEDVRPHDTLLCVQTSTLITDEKRLRYGGTYFLKSLDQMRQTFRPLADLPDSAYSNTLKIAEMCDVDPEDGTYHLPDIVIPEGFTYETYLRYLTEEGLRRRYGARAGDPDVLARTEHELKIIHAMGFDVYYLIVWDLCMYAQRRGIWWNVRGSGAGSIVAYAIGVTNLDPLRNKLIFERFLNPGRVTMPDFDLDFPDDQREELIRYTVGKYGNDRVAQIVTFGRMKARASVRDVGRAMAVPLDEVDKIAKLIPAIPGKPVTIKDVLTEGQEFYSADLRQLYDGDEKVRQLLDIASELDGVARHSSIHAAAVIVADKPLTHYTPLMRPPKSAITQTVAQYEYPILESIGLLKVDFLGLATLTLMREAARLIKERHGVEYTLENLPIDDPKTYELLTAGDVMGVFQVEGCLSGDTFVGSRTIKELYEQFTAHQAPESLNWAQRLKTDSCYLDSGRFTTNQILKVIYSGVKPVFRLVDERGYWIKATEDHHFLTQRGWVRLGELDPDTDRLLVKSNIKWAGRSCVDCGEPLKTYYRKAQRCKHCSARMTANPSRPEVQERISVNTMGRVPWNRGLTAETAADTLWIKNLTIYNDSQRGLPLEERLGPEKAARIREGLSRRNAGRGNPMYGRPPRSTKTYTNAGYREDLGHYVRSSWEADLARVFRHLGWVYQYEPRTFELIDEQGVPSTYTPDFYVPELDQWYEVKGWMDAVSARKIALFRAQYPEHDLVIVDKTLFAEFQLQYAELVAWECPQIPAESEWVTIREISTAGEEDTYDLQMRAPGNNFLANGFVVHNSGMRRCLMDLRPTEFDHITATISLYRPGPMEFIPDFIACLHGEKQPEYVHKVLEPILSETMGVCVYQEQVIQILSDIAGYTPGEADLVRRGISKKSKKTLDEHREIFARGSAAKSGLKREDADAIWDALMGFARYGFNRAHAADYAVIVAQTGYLKAHYPVEYMAALLTVERHDTAKVGLLIAECRRMGIEVLPPNVNVSGHNFTVERLPAGRMPPRQVTAFAFPVEEGTAIRMGLDAVKNVGEGPIETILRARGDRPFAALLDFTDRVDSRQVNRRGLECLIKVGALDDFGPRGQLIAALDRIMGASEQAHQAREIGQYSLFGGFDDDGAAADDLLSHLPDAAKINPKEILEWEKELVGVYVSSHPLQQMTVDLMNVITHSTVDITEELQGKGVVIAGMVADVRTFNTKKGDTMAFVRLEDLQGSVDVTVFPQLYREKRALWVLDKIVIVTGKVEVRNGRVSVVADVVQDYVEGMKVHEDTGSVAYRFRSGGASAGPGRPLMREPAPRANGAPAAIARPAARSAPPDLPVGYGGDEDEDSYFGDENPFAGDEPDWMTDAPPPWAAGNPTTAGPDPAPPAQPAQGLAAQPSVQPRPVAASAPTASKAVSPEQPSAAQRQAVSLATTAPPPNPPRLQNPGATSAAPSVPQAATPRTVKLNFRRSHSLDADRKRLADLVALLDRYPGEDRFEIVVEASGAASYVLDFPNNRTRFCRELQAELSRRLGAGGWKLEG